MTQVNNNNNNSQFNVDTTYTKVFVGGLAWETQKDTMKQYFEQFGNILEAVVISDKSTGRSKGYGFVTYCEAESAMKACMDPTPLIDGRRANCNLAAFAVQKSKPSSPTKQGVIERRSMSNSYVKKGGGVRVFGCATTLPHYAAVQQGPIANYSNVVGYSQDYAYPTNYYCGINGGATAGQYPIYGTAGGAANVGMTMTSMKRVSATAAPYYPCVQYPTRGTFTHYPYHTHHQQQHLIHPAPYSAMSLTSGSYTYHPYVYGGPTPILMALPAPILHR